VELPSKLFSSLQVGAIACPNRIVMAPLTRSRADIDGVQTPLAAEYYSQRASAGFMVTESTDISAQARGFMYSPGLYTPAHVTAWRGVTDAVHAAGGRLVVQLCHVGRISSSIIQPGRLPPVAPSAIQATGMAFSKDGPTPMTLPRALRTEELPGIVEDFRHAARCALLAGFDGIELHMGNSFLLDQFLRDSTNRRTDGYGGSVDHRLRFPLEVVQAAIDVWGANRIGVRISPVKTKLGETPLDSDPQTTYGDLAMRLGAARLAYLHCIEGPGVVGPRRIPFDFRALRRAFGGIYLANGGYDRAKAMSAVAASDIDMVALGFPFISNPDLVERLVLDAPLARADPSTFYGGNARGYTDYPPMQRPGRASSQL
jgi:N-ethylmaleimide reductase